MICFVSTWQFYIQFLHSCPIHSRHFPSFQSDERAWHEPKSSQHRRGFWKLKKPPFEVSGLHSCPSSSEALSTMVNLKRLASSSLIFLSSAVYATAAVVVPNPDTPGGPIVDLGYSVYQGQTLSNGVNEWLGLRFGAPPIGNLRFRKPQQPANTTGIIQANKFGPVCFGLSNGIGATFGEDCLFLNLWGPANITRTSKFAVFLWLTGGAYLRDANANVRF